MHGPEDTGRRRRRPHSGRNGHPSKDKAARPPKTPKPEPEPEQPQPVGDDLLHIFTTEQAREVDRLCAEQYGIPTILLMENAALGITGVVRQALAEIAAPTVLIVCGPGNNGGDGLAVARHLFNDGTPVSIILSAEADTYKGDAAINVQIVKKLGIPITVHKGSADATLRHALAPLGGDPDLVIDALLGTGIDRPPVGRMAELIELVNSFHERQGAVLAVDIPSGLNADTGEPFLTRAGEPGPVVRANLTVSLLGLKPGFIKLEAQEFLGDCVVAGIGAPPELIARLGEPYGGSVEDWDQGDPEGEDDGPGRG